MAGFKENSFLKKVITLGSGTALAHIILFLSSPILTRIYAPDSFGVLALFMSLASIFMAISSGKYESGIILPEENKDAVHVLYASWWTNLWVSIAFYVLWLVSFLLPSAWLGEYHQYKYLWLLIPVFGSLQLLFESLKQWALREEAYKNMSLSNLIKAIATLILQIGLAFVAVKPGIGLIAGMVFSLMIGNRMLWRVFKASKKDFDASFSKKEVKKAMKDYKKFPLYTTPSILLNSFVQQIPVWLLSSISMAVTGLYNLAERILQAPLLLIGHSVGQVYYKNAKEIKENHSALQNLTWKVYQNLFYIMLIPFAILLFLGGPIFAWIFGEEWRFAGKIAGFIAPQLLFNFSVSPISNLWYIFNRNQHGVYFQLTLLLGRLLILVLFFTVFQQNIDLFFMSLGLWGALVYGVLAWAFMRRLQLAHLQFFLRIVFPFAVIMAIYYFNTINIIF